MERELVLTFDMDWANDDVLRYFHQLICKLNLCGTLNVTHNTPVLKEIRKEGRLELGIHPNFNKLLENSGGGGSNLYTIIENLLEIVPEAKSVRSHSLVQSSLISKCFAAKGLKYESNTLYYISKGVKLKSYKDIWGLIQVPFVFEDDVYLLSEEKKQIEWYLSDDFESPRVFNFHPIHLFLNTDKIERYEAAKQYTKNYEMLKQYRNNKINGTEDIFKELVFRAKEKGYIFRKLKEASYTITDAQKSECEHSAQL